MAPPQATGGGWSRFRRVFRWLRLFLLVLTCAVVAAIVYLNEVGLPKFLSSRISSELARRGFDVDFSTLYLDGYRKIVVRNLRFAEMTPGAPQLSIGEAMVRLDRSALKHFEFKVSGLSVREGRMVLPLTSRTLTNQFKVEHIQTEIEFRTNNHWILTHGEGAAFGARLRLSANITNALSLQKLRVVSTNANALPWPEQLQEFVQVMEQIEFRTPPKLSLAISGDARDLMTFSSSFKLQSLAAITPWGRMANLNLHAELGPAGDGIAAHLEATLDAARTPWAQASQVSLRSSVFYPGKQSVFTSDWQLDANEIVAQSFQSPGLHLSVHSSDRNGTLSTQVAARAALPQFGGIKAQDAQFEVELAHESPFQNAAAIFAQGKFLEYLSRIGSAWRGRWNMKLQEPRADWGQCASLTVSGSSASVSPARREDAALGFWNFLQPFKSDVAFSTTEPIIRGMKLNELSAQANWNPPLLELRSLKAAGLGGTLSVTGRLDVIQRETQVSALSNLDPHEVATVMGKSFDHWLSEWHWEKPPVIELSCKTVLPAWTNGQSHWMSRIEPASLNGTFKSGVASFRSIPIRGAYSRFGFSNHVWTLNDLEIERSEGAFRAKGQTDLKTSAFDYQFESHLDPHFGTNFLAPDARVVGELFQFPEAPTLAGTVSGNWTNLDTLAFNGGIGLTNFLFKNEPVSSISSRLQFTNSILSFADVVIRRGRERVDIASGAYPISQEVIDVTNVVSTLDPAWFAKISTRVIQKAIGPYLFDEPPLVHAYGRIPLFAPSKADIHFGVEGERFHYWRFSAPRISGGIWWKGDRLSVTNIQADFYSGHLDWEGHFHFLPNDSADYSFRANVTNINLPVIVADLVRTTNDMKGELTGKLVVTSANTEDMQSWRGFGNASVKDGFLWNIPLFGNFTHLLGTISPNLGKLPATAADMTFTLEKSVVHTHDLEMKTAALRLKYMGTVDMEGRLDAKVEAILLRDWVFGKAFSVVFWPISKILEYKVTGTLQNPKSRPLYLPGIITSPMQTIKKLVPGSTDKSAAPELKPAQPARDQNQNPSP